MAGIDDLLEQRKQQHGDFSDHARIAQALITADRIDRLPVALHPSTVKFVDEANGSNV